MKDRGHSAPAGKMGSRGRDWGLPETGVGANPVARPIVIRCSADKLVLPPNETGARKEVKFHGATQDSVDELVTGIWQHMESWGTAGRGMYWKPELVFECTPDAAQRYEELQQQLSESGFTLRARQSTATIPSPTRK